jgi:cellulose synthase/poly-beta-1,6-N-acetylglucosamine synthase-like glycosyltransferase
VCLQSKLNFYNAKENILTTLFSIEYSIWFEYLLKGLDLFGLPITLGGTSNHFKVDKLREVGAWDAYNVTEDADLGIRLYLKGYKVSMIDSTTMEEAPNNLKDWMMQRSRWIKGFIQTILVFSKSKNNFVTLDLLKSMTVVTFIGLSTYSILFLPWLFFILYLDLSQFSYYVWLTNSFFSFSYLYAIAYFVLANSDSQIKIRTIYGMLILLIWPFYFILHTIAGYKSIFDVIVSPFKWSKTPHGNSKLQR